MSSRPPNVLSGGTRRSPNRRRRSRRRGGRRRRSLRPAVVVATAIALLIAIGGLVDELTNSSSSAPERSAAAGKVGRPQPAGTPSSVAAERPGQFAVDMTRPDVVRIHFKHGPRAGLLFDIGSGRVLWRHEPTRTLPIASLTKMMTALIVVEENDPHD